MELSSSVDPLIAASVTTTTTGTNTTGTTATTSTTVSTTTSNSSNEDIADHPLLEASDTNTQLSADTITDTPQ